MLGQRLRLARKKAGFSMRELAGRLSPPITAQAISKYEAGRMMPSSAVLIGLGRTLDVSLDFLTGGQVEALTGIEFRKHSGTSAKDRARAEAIVTEQLEDYLTIEDILEIAPPADPFGDLRCDRVGSFDEVEDKAGALRTRWDLGLDPVPSVTALLEDRGIRVVAADLPARCDGLACGVTRSGNRPSTEAVVISVRTNVERRRLTLAHELAHRVIRDTGRPGHSDREGDAPVRSGVLGASGSSARRSGPAPPPPPLSGADATEALLRNIGGGHAAPSSRPPHSAGCRRRVRLPDVCALVANARAGTNGRQRRSGDLRTTAALRTSGLARAGRRNDLPGSGGGAADALAERHRTGNQGAA